MTTWTRRRFLAYTALITPGLQTVIHATPLGGPIGIQLYAVKDALQADPVATLRTIKEIGFGEVETAGFGRLSARQFRALLDDAGLRCPSAHLQLEMGNLGAAFEQAHALGAHYAASGSLRAVAGAQPPLGMSLDEARRTAELANRIGEQARRAGLQYVYHNHDFEFADQGGGVIGYDVLLRETGPALVDFEIDCGWMVLGGRDPRDYFERYPNRFPMIHVKDFLPKQNKSAPPGTESMRGSELGRGVVDYKPILVAAQQGGLKHLFVEQEGPFARMGQLEAAQVAYDYLRSISGWRD